MAIEPFTRKIEALRRRLADMAPNRKAANGETNGAGAANAFNPWQELQTAVEELFVAQEELRGQNDELMQTRLELEAERQRYHDLFEFAPDPYLATDLEGVIQEANRAAGELLNMPQALLTGKPLVLFVAPEDRLAFQAQLTRLGRGTSADGWDLCLRPREQSPLAASVTVAAVRDARGGPTALRWLIRDVTAHKQSERLAVIGQMMAGLAHESRNALQRAQACLERLNWKLQGQPEAHDLLARLQHAQNDLVRLFEDVREYAAPLKLDLQLCDLGGVWREAWARVSCLHEERDARLEEEETGEVDRHCHADPLRLTQVFRNLFENALAACADPVRVVVRCGETMLAGAPALRVAVRDNGPGLNAEQKQRVFEPFFTTKSQGMGLGMTIAQQIVETHGGRISVGDALTLGAEIVLTLPRRKP